MEVNRVPASLYYYAIFIKNIRTVYRIFSNSFFLGGRGGGALIRRGRLFNNFSLRGGANSKGGAYLKLGANSSIYGTSIFKLVFPIIDVLTMNKIGGSNKSISRHFHRLTFE